jgi:hypothetical protein
MKKKLFFNFFVFAVIGALVTMTSCKDYDDDISNLESQLSSLKGTVDQIDAAVKAGSVISNVASTDGGITITLSNGQSYDITNGTNGANGADGSVVTIGENGNWFIDGVDTELAARGPQGETGAPGADGKDGVDGKDGAPGADGKDGAYYYPNEDGFWWKVDGETEMATDMTWLPAGTITAVWDDDAQTVTLYNVEGADGPIPFGNVAIVSLHLIPDYVMPTGSLPMIVFQSLVTEDCGNISAPVVARFRVSPSNASVNAINTKDLAFLYNDPTVFDVYRSAEIAPVATFKSLENGILEVYVDINTAKLEDLYESDKMDNLQLEVPLKNGSKVYSDWMGVTSQEFDEIMLVNVQNDPEDAFDDYAFTTGLEETMELEIDELPVVHIKYDNTFDLIDVVQTMIVDPEMELDTDAYGLTYKFDLLDEEGEVIEYIETENNTDQQDFISLLDGDKGTVKSKVFSQQDSRTAIGRTPIVRVRLMNDDCVVYTAFIKINWTEDEPVPLDPLNVELAKTVKFDCGELTVTSTVQWMNEEIYSALGLTKQEFHASYELAEGVYDADGELDETLGYVEELVDLDTGLTTNLFVWTFQPEADNNVVTGYIHYLQGTRVAVKVKVTATVTMPTLGLHGLNTTYWNAARNLFTVNPIVYGNTEAGADANIYADLLRGFLNVDGEYSMDETAIVKSTGAVPATVTFQFDETKLANYTYFIDDVEYSVAKENLSISEDGTELLLGTEAAATIAKDPTNGYKIYLDGDGTNATDAAKALIGKKVPVKVVSDLCGDGEFVETLKSYEVFFIEPIKINAEIDGSFEDAVIGGSRIGIGEGLTFTDWNNYAVREEAYEDPTAKQEFASELYTYYGILPAVWNVDDATSNLKLVNGDRVPTEGYTEGPILELGYRITFDGDTNELVFWNDEGVKLMEPFEIYVPVTVSHKWGSTSEIVTIVVNPTQ